MVIFFFRIFLLVIAILLFGQVAERAYAKTPLTLVVGYSAGGASDIAAREIAKDLSKELNKDVIVENRPGGSGVISVQRLIQAKPDGNTILLADSRILYTNWFTVENLSYTLEDFTLGPVFVKAPFLLVGNRALLPDTDLLTWLRENHASINFVTAGMNSPHHVLLNQIQTSLKVNFQHIPMQGDAQAIVELLGKRAHLGLFGPVSIEPHITHPDLVILGVIWDAPFKEGVFKEIPTLNDLGFQGIDNQSMMAWVFPKGTDESLIDSFSLVVKRVLSTSEMKAKLARIGFFPYEVDKVTLRNQIEELHQ